MSAKVESSVFTKLLTNGLGAFLLTEDSILKTFKPLGLPRDASKYLIRQVERRKDEILQILRDELHQMLTKMPLEKIARDILATMDLEVTISFVPRRASTGRKLGHRWKSKK
jgi:hypothetical protein